MRNASRFGRNVFAMALAASAALAHARPLDAQLDCKSTAARVHRAASGRPICIESQANARRAEFDQRVPAGARARQLTAFGFKVYARGGISEGRPDLQAGQGRARSATAAYGAVVSAATTKSRRRCARRAATRSVAPRRALRHGDFLQAVVPAQQLATNRRNQRSHRMSLASRARPWWRFGTVSWTSRPARIDHEAFGLQRIVQLP